MFDVRGNISQHINADAHQVAQLNNQKNEAVLEFNAVDINWRTLEVTVHGVWVAHIRLNPPMVNMKKVK